MHTPQHHVLLLFARLSRCGWASSFNTLFSSPFVKICSSASDNALAFLISLFNGDSADIVPGVNEWGQVASKGPSGSQIVEPDVDMAKPGLFGHRSELFGVGIENRESELPGDIVGEVMIGGYGEST
jgi:hypothetical protein